MLDLFERSLSLETMITLCEASFCLRAGKMAPLSASKWFASSQTRPAGMRLHLHQML